jgi:hypothetical protein
MSTAEYNIALRGNRAAPIGTYFRPAYWYNKALKNILGSVATSPGQSW